MRTFHKGSDGSLLLTAAASIVGGIAMCPIWVHFIGSGGSLQNVEYKNNQKQKKCKIINKNGCLWVAAQLSEV